MHDCSVATGDAWLKRFVAPLLRVPDTVVFVVFDEGTGSNRVAALALGTAVRPHAVFTRRVDHYGLLRTIEDMWALPHLGAARAARPISGISSKTGRRQNLNMAGLELISKIKQGRA